MNCMNYLKKKEYFTETVSNDWRDFNNLNQSMIRKGVQLIDIRLIPFLK